MGSKAGLRAPADTVSADSVASGPGGAGAGAGPAAVQTMLYVTVVVPSLAVSTMLTVAGTVMAADGWPLATVCPCTVMVVPGLFAVGVKVTVVVPAGAVTV